MKTVELATSEIPKDLQQRSPQKSSLKDPTITSDAATNAANTKSILRYQPSSSVSNCFNAGN